ncbi:GFA family protein [Marinimicrococcus flavescens]|uniref:GFA family protein n=1 Tax=Marinimicrococcus flavescens TaxID=3031815 RepID=A0AAP4D6P6_9PROT|nr:GFA family protein [Marinimicrococcus flavescens]
MDAVHRGTCFCGAVEIEASGEPLETGFCHCSSCRSYSGAPLTAFILWKAEQVRITRGAGLVGRFNKTGMSERHFCSRCGGHLMSGHPTLGLTDVHAAILPSIPFHPTIHLNYAETVLPMHDGLPKLRDFPVEAGGSGEVVEE